MNSVAKSPRLTTVIKPTAKVITIALRVRHFPQTEDVHDARSIFLNKFYCPLAMALKEFNTVRQPEVSFTSVKMYAPDYKVWTIGNSGYSTAMFNEDFNKVLDASDPDQIIRIITLRKIP